MTTIRKFPLVTNETYHIFNKSIAGYEIFNTKEEFLRIVEVIKHYLPVKTKIRFSKREEIKNDDSISLLPRLPQENKLVEIIAYCIMPTHIHLILKQTVDKGISTFMSLISNSYSRYFNLKHKRKGPLWENEFKNVLITSDEQLLHLTRYIHLNPVSAFIVNRPGEWTASSYKEYLGEIDDAQKICNFNDLLTVVPSSYREFVENRISYQRELAQIKHLILE